MRIRIPQEQLSTLLARSQSIVERKSTRPILENVLIEAFEDGIRVSATDLRISLTQKVGCTVEQAGSVSLSARKLHEIVRELPKGSLSLELREDLRATVSSGKSVFHLPGTPPEEYPTIPVSPGELVDYPAPVFRRMLEATLFAASTDESRIYLTGVFMKHWDRDDGALCLRMVSTDGHRLSLIDRKVEQEIPNVRSGVIIPKKGLAELRALLDGREGNFRITVDEGKLFASADDCEISIILIDSTFPNYEQVIPSDVRSWMDLSRADLLNALRRVAILSDDETRTVVMETKQDEMILTSDNARMGDAREEIEIRYSGNPTRMAFNAQYFQEVLRVMEGGRVRIGITDSLAPCLVKDADDPDYLSVVMPMRID